MPKVTGQLELGTRYRGQGRAHGPHSAPLCCQGGGHSPHSASACCGDSGPTQDGFQVLPGCSSLRVCLRLPLPGSPPVFASHNSLLAFLPGPQLLPNPLAFLPTRIVHQPQHRYCGGVRIRTLCCLRQAATALTGPGSGLLICASRWCGELVWITSCSSQLPEHPEASLVSTQPELPPMGSPWASAPKVGRPASRALGPFPVSDALAAQREIAATPGTSRVTPLVPWAPCLLAQPCSLKSRHTRCSPHLTPVKSSHGTRTGSGLHSQLLLRRHPLGHNISDRCPVGRECGKQGKQPGGSWLHPGQQGPLGPLHSHQAVL